MGRVCPNCGTDMEYYRTDRQPTADREVEMRWHLCPVCRHVSLVDWRSSRLNERALAPDRNS